jgi:hypothetical protein
MIRIANRFFFTNSHITFRLLSVGILTVGLLIFNSCKNEEKNTDALTTLPVDTVQVTNALQSINLPHADTVYVPIVSAVLDQAFDACEKKDYAKLAGLIVYRGEDSLRHGYDVFNTKSNYERKVITITGNVMQKWKSQSESVDYARAFEWPQPDGRTMIVLEVYFISKKFVDRKFFGFLEVNGGYKIADITSQI